MLAFPFIGGWGNVKKSYAGSVGQLRCPSCNQVSEWKIYDIEKRATAFFIPVLTYASERVVICSGCGAGSKVTNVEIAELRKRSKVEALSAAGGFGVRGALEQWVEGLSMRGPNPELDDWLDRLAATAAGVGYAETRRRRGGRLYRVPVLATAEFRMGSTRLATRLLASEEEASILESRMEAVKSAAIRDGRLQAIAHGRQVSTGSDPQRLPEGSLGRWAAAASSVSPTSEGGGGFLRAIAAGLDAASLGMNIAMKEAGLPRRPPDPPAAPCQAPAGKPKSARKPQRQPRSKQESAAERTQLEKGKQRVQKELRKARSLGAGMRGRRTRSGNPELVTWLDLLAWSLSQQGYVKKKVTWGEDFRGVRTVLSAARA